MGSADLWYGSNPKGGSQTGEGRRKNTVRHKWLPVKERNSVEEERGEDIGGRRIKKKRKKNNKKKTTRRSRSTQKLDSKRRDEQMKEKNRDSKSDIRQLKTSYKQKT